MRPAQLTPENQNCLTKVSLWIFVSMRPAQLTPENIICSCKIWQLTHAFQ